MVHGVLIKNGKLSVQDVEDELDVYYKILECDLIDIVERKIGNARYSIVCDEEGLFHEINLISMMREGFQTPMLVGSLFICKNNGAGELESLTDADVENIKSKFKFGVIWGDY